ncbi:MAG: acetyl-CoA carboxylase carboxyltransferase subunit beta [Nitrospirae bacterium]|uniref:acetyl-CoA carboxylase, carboxyltransferase subunit beta n=1 Tax=Candidatus Magnetobacterium casense TaxID=1455061 RepID=UPI00058D3310|nr:acetyl-CoA carboxylase, carboxyltransferase subunit beta [Candidatus Magnetobacterium casensis]MBF0336518.1 acetyl-CoA carboxylase carboxyltransferase subunit beta [Nitrospirota bacterium]
MAWFKRSKDISTQKRVNIPEGLWVKCNSCKEIVYRKELAKNLRVCPKCAYHFRLGARERINMLIDSGTFVELDASLTSADPLEFTDTISYNDRLLKNQQKSNLKEAVVTGTGTINRLPIAIAAMDFSFMGGSMGSAVGEKLVRVIDAAAEGNTPLVVCCASGGARMQEGIYSLMQMAKVSAAIGRLRNRGLVYIALLTDPTFGGVSASFAMLGDVIIAEPKALIGFAGARVIQQTISQQLPADFQQAEFLLKNGQIDMVVNRKDLKLTITKLLRILKSL